MCILFAYINPKPEPGGYKIILASNRDESWKRPSTPAHEWVNELGIYGGKDMQPGKEGGTWLVMNKFGRIGVLLNIGQSEAETAAAADPSSGRGFYAVEWVTKMEKDMEGVFGAVKEMHANRQQTFRLAAIDINGEPKVGALAYAGEKFDGFLEEYLTPGIHALGNNAPNTTWNKVIKGKEQFETIINEFKQWKDKSNLIQELTKLLTSREKYWPDSGIAQQMKTSESIMECLSAIFVEVPHIYGTRTHSVILVSTEDQALFYEKTMENVDNWQPENWIENCFEFPLESKKN